MHRHERVIGEMGMGKNTNKVCYATHTNELGAE